MIFAILFSSGKTPSWKEELHISLRMGEIVLLIDFNILIGKDEGPDDLLSSSSLMIS